MGEWGIALVGFFGAIVGAVVGFVGISWQHSATRDEDIRKAGAQLLYQAEVIANSYQQYRKLSLARRTSSDIREKSEAAEAKLGELLRYIEVVASPELYGKVALFVVETGKFSSDVEYLAASQTNIPQDKLAGAIESWYARRNQLVLEFKYPGRLPWRIRLLRLQHLVFKRG